MHTIKSQAATYYVVIELDGDIMAVFQSPKLIVALAVCNLLNGGTGDLEPCMGSHLSRKSDEIIKGFENCNHE